jgi:hypothetical protein
MTEKAQLKSNVDEYISWGHVQEGSGGEGRGANLEAADGGERAERHAARGWKGGGSRQLRVPSGHISMTRPGAPLVRVLRIHALCTVRIGDQNAWKGAGAPR